MHKYELPFSTFCALALKKRRTEGFPFSPKRTTIVFPLMIYQTFWSGAVFLSFFLYILSYCNSFFLPDIWQIIDASKFLGRLDSTRYKIQTVCFYLESVSKQVVNKSVKFAFNRETFLMILKKESEKLIWTLKKMLIIQCWILGVDHSWMVTQSFVWTVL